MADNVELDAGTGGATIKTDDDGTAHWQYVKMAYGADNTQTRVTTAAPLPVDLRTDNLSGNLDVNLAASAATVTVDGSGVTQPVSGTVTANAGTGTFTVDLGANNDVTIDNSSIVHAEDAAHNTGDAGIMALAVRKTADAPLSGTDGDYEPLQTDENGYLKVNIKAGSGSGTQYAVDSALGATPTGTVFVAKRDDALSTLTPVEGDAVEARVNANGALWTKHDGNITVDGTVTANAGTGTFTIQEATALDVSAATVTTTDASIATEGSALGSGILIQGDDGTDRKNINVDATTGDVQVDVTNTVTVNGTVTADLSATDNAVLDTIETNTDFGTVTGGGTEASALRVTLANDSTGVLTVDDGGSTISIDDGGGEITVNGTVTANLGATDNAVLDDIAAKLAPNATNGHSFYLNQDTNAVSSVKASAGTIYWIACMSTDATPVYLNLYNVASGSVTLGTTTPDLQFIVPSPGDSNGAGFTINFGPLGVQFDTAITVAAATTYNGSTDPGANVVITNIGYE